MHTPRDRHVSSKRDGPVQSAATILELSQMNGGLFSGIAINGPTLIRLALVLVLAIAVRQLILRFGTKAIESRRDKSRNSKPRR
jgi:hypothetical protein